MKAILIPALLFMAQATATDVLIAEPAPLSQQSFESNGFSFAKVGADDTLETLHLGDQVTELGSHETYTLTGEIITTLPSYVVAQKVADALGYQLSYVRGQRAIFSVNSQDIDLLEAYKAIKLTGAVLSIELGMKPDAIEAE